RERARREPTETSGDELLEEGSRALLRDPVARRGGDVLDERSNEQGVASRLAGDRARLLAELGALARAEEPEGEGPGAVEIEVSDLEVMVNHRRPRQRPRQAQRAEERRGVRVRVAVDQDQEERRGLGRREELAEELGAVEVAPVRVIDNDDDGGLGRQTTEEPPEGGREQLPTGRLLRRRARAGLRETGAAEDREHLGDDRQVIAEAIEEPMAMLEGLPGEEPGERVEEAIDGAEGER